MVHYVLRCACCCCGTFLSISGDGFTKDLQKARIFSSHEDAERGAQGVGVPYPLIQALLDREVAVRAGLDKLPGWSDFS